MARSRQALSSKRWRVRAQAELTLSGYALDIIKVRLNPDIPEDRADQFCERIAEKAYSYALEAWEKLRELDS